MLPLWEMIAKAQNGQAMGLIARQFALSQAQVQAAVDALLPAFGQALKRKAGSDPYGFGAFMAGSAGGGYAKYFEDASRAFTPEGMAAGNAVLAQIFGSKELSRAIAAQAAQATGIGQEIMKQMLPALAALTTGGVLKQFADAMPKAGQPGANPFADFLAAMAQASAAPPGTAAPQGVDAVTQAWANPWNKAFADMWGAASPQPPAGDPLGRMFGQWTAAASAAQETEGANPYNQAVNQMFETGRQQRDEYLRGVDRLFDQFGKGTKQE